MKWRRKLFLLFIGLLLGAAPDQWCSAEEPPSHSDQVIRKRWTVTPAILVTLSTYRQTSFPLFTQWGITAKLFGRYDLILDRLSLEGNGQYTVVPIVGNIPNTSMRYLETYLNLGYQVLPLTSSWRLRLLTGVNDLASDSSTSLGFGNTLGPQLGAQAEYHFQGSFFTAYAKYSPFFNSVSVASPNFQVALGETILFVFG